MKEEGRQEALLNKLNLSGLNPWTPEVTAKACSLLTEYHDIFSLEKNEIRHAKAVEHKIVLKDPEAAPSRNSFFKLMLEAGAILPSNSP